MSFEIIETYDETSLLDGLMDVHVKYASNISSDETSFSKHQAVLQKLAAVE
jgi:hypothetical protein